MCTGKHSLNVLKAFLTFLHGAVLSTFKYQREVPRNEHKQCQLHQSKRFAFFNLKSRRSHDEHFCEPHLCWEQKAASSVSKFSFPEGGGKPALFNICSQRCPSASLNAHFLEVQVGFCLTIHGMQGGEGLLALGRAERPAVSSSS